MSAKQRKITGLLFLIGFVATSGPAYAGNRRAIPDHSGDAEPVRAIPLKIYRNYYMVAEGQFGGIPEVQNFVLDTGTSPSIVNARVAERLGLATTNSEITAVGKTTPSQSAIMPSIELGPIRAESVPVLVKDLSRLERDWGIPIAGIIGLDVLSKSSFRLDYDTREIEFGAIPHDGVPVHFDERAGIAVAEVKLAGRPLRMLVDTGSEALVLLGGNFAEVGWLQLRNTRQWGKSLAAPNINVQLFSAPDITLGRQHFRTDRAYFVPGSADPDFDGLLGVRALGIRALSYDQASGTIFLQK